MNVRWLFIKIKIKTNEYMENNFVILTKLNFWEKF